MVFVMEWGFFYFCSTLLVVFLIARLNSPPSIEFAVAMQGVKFRSRSLHRFAHFHFSFFSFVLSSLVAPDFALLLEKSKLVRY